MSNPDLLQRALALFSILEKALDEDNQTRKAAEQKLLAAEEEIDCFASLAMITVAEPQEADIKIRLLAAVCGKNAVARSWRRHGRSALKNNVTDEERDYVCRTLYGALGKTEQIVGTQLSLWIANISTIDFPMHWPNLIADLRDSIKNHNQAVMIHAMLTLDMVLQHFENRRLGVDRKALYQIAPSVFSTLYTVFEDHLQILVSNQATPDVSQSSFRVMESCLKSFCKLVEFGCRTINELPRLSSVFTKFLEFPAVFMRGAEGGTEMQVKLSHLAATLICVTQQHFPIDFQPFIPAFLERYYNAIVAFDSSVSSDIVCYQGASFIKCLLQPVSYDISTGTVKQFHEAKQSGAVPPNGVSADACRYLILSFFDQNRVDAIILAILSRVFVLSEQELEVWENDPEKLIRGEEVCEWGTESLRSECEHIFNFFCLQEKSRVVPMFLSFIESVPRDKPLLLDACYRALGSIAHDMKGQIDIQAWLSGRLINILRADCSANLGERVVQARTAWLVGQFVEELTRESRQVVTSPLLKLMSASDGDRVVALTSAKTLQYLVDDVGFISRDFAPYLNPCIVSSFRLVFFAETVATKRELIGVVSSLILRSQPHDVLPVIELIGMSLPNLWQEGRCSHPGHVGNVANNGLMGNGDQNLLRTAIVMMLSILFRKVGPAALQVPSMKSSVFEIIDFAVDLTPGRGGSFMMEEGCELWTLVASSAEAYMQELDMLFPRALKILQVDFNNLKEVFHLMEEYALVGKEQFMIRYAGGMLDVLTNVLQNTRERGCLAALGVMDKLLQLFPVEGVRSIAAVLQLCLKKVLSGMENQVMTSAYVALLARACLMNIEDVESLVLQRSEKAAIMLMESLIGSADSGCKLQKRKLVGYASCGLTTRYCQSEEVQNLIPHVLRVIMHVLKALQQRERESEHYTDDFNKFLSNFGKGGDANEADADVKLPGELRRRILADQDILRQVDLRVMFTEMLNKFRNVSEERYNAVMLSVDKRVLDTLGSLTRNSAQ